MYKRLLTTGFLLAALPAAAAELDVVSSYESLATPGFAPWRNVEAQVVDNNVGPLAKAGGAVQASQRFNQYAAGAEVFGVSQLNHDAALEYRVRGSGGADFLPKKGAELTLDAALGWQLEGSFGLVRNLYAKDSSTLVKARVDRQLGNWRAGAGVIADVAHLVHTTFGALGYSRGPWSTELAYYQGAEASRDDVGVVSVLPVKTVAWHVRYRLGKTTGLLLGVAKHWGADMRTGVTVGLSHSF